MSALDLTLLRPLWLLALIPLGAFGWWALSRRGGLGAWEQAANPALLAALRALGRIEGGVDRMPVICGLLAASITVLALAGPAVERRDALSFRNLDGVVFVMDASPSVTEHRRWPQILTMGRFALTALGTRPGGLIVFGGDSYVATDMTADLHQLGQTFSLISPETVPDPGSRPAGGLRDAARMLREADVIAGDVVLFTDGAGLGPDSLREAEAIAAQGARLSVVAVDGASPLLETHAIGGRLFTLDDTDALANWLRMDARTRLEQQDYPLLFWSDYGRYLLVLALFPLLALFRRVAQ